MRKGRLEAFSDGVIAIILTIMVLEMKAPHAATWDALRPLYPVFGSYLFSFVFIGIYWNNHHHLLHAIECVNGYILWANLYLLFWLSLIPFATAWMGESSFAAAPVALYGLVLLFAGKAYFLLTRVLVSYHGSDSRLARAVGNDRKGLLSMGLYVVAIPLAFVSPWISVGLYAAVALMWLIPDPRIEKFYADCG